MKKEIIIYNLIGLFGISMSLFVFWNKIEWLRFTAIMWGIGMAVIANFSVNCIRNIKKRSKK